MKDYHSLMQYLLFLCSRLLGLFSPFVQDLYTFKNTRSLSLSPFVVSVLKLNFHVNCPAHETTQMYTSSVEIKSITLENRCLSSLQSIDCMKWALTVPAYKIFFLYCIIIPILGRVVSFFTVNLRNELAYNIALVQFWVKGPATNLVRSVLV